MAKITYYLTNSEHISEIDVSVGNLLYCEDTKRIYLDGQNGRVCYDSIMVFELDSERELYQNPTEGFYFVEETHILWRYANDEWVEVTAPPSSNVVFIPKSELPAEGESEVLYVCDQEMFTWDADGNEYLSMNADSVWHEV